MNGRLRTCSQNPRYFTDNSGKAIYLTGSHTWAVMNDMWLEGDTPHRMDYQGFLQMMQDNGHNFMRFWQYNMQPKCAPWNARDTIFEPQPFARIGEALAQDGKPKFDLTKKNPEYFDRLRQRIVQAKEKGIYCAVMLFEAWAIKWATPDQNCWKYYPFNAVNNINDVDDDPCLKDGRAWKVFSLDCPKILEAQKRYVKWVAEELSDMDNVLWEICNEMPNTPYALDWQKEICAYLRDIESTLGTPHPIGISAEGGDGDTEELLASNADWTAPSNGRKYEYRYNPPLADGRKVLFNDTDHLWGHGCETAWIWKSFTRGYNVIFMDPWEPIPGDLDWWQDGTVSRNTRYYYRWDEMRRNMGYTNHYANRMDLLHAQPDSDVCTSTYCLANKGSQYLIFYPAGGTEGIDLWDVAGEFKVEWLEVQTGRRYFGDRIQGGNRYALEAPFTGSAVLYIHSADQADFESVHVYKAGQ